jgi:hypothetical protein
MPKGANQGKVAKAGLWKPKKPRRTAAVCFDLKGPCDGDMYDVIDLGVNLAKEALARGDKDLAKAILRKIKKVPVEYRKRELEEKRARLIKQLEKEGQ